jgi:hypothetical protein
MYAIRHMFLSKRIRHTFTGYAYSQLKRLEGHYQWLKNPPTGEPVLDEYGGMLVTSSKGGQEKVFGKQSDLEKYESAARHWRQYQKWLAERNPARAALEERYGYDTKHAAHLVRLLLKARSILRTEDYNPILEGEELDTVICVLNGGWEYERLVQWAGSMDDEVRSIYSRLPNSPYKNDIERVLASINIEWLKEIG